VRQNVAGCRMRGSEAPAFRRGERHGSSFRLLVEEISMQILNYSEIKTVDGKLAFQDRLEGMIKYGFSWPKDILAQDTFTNMLQRELDQRSTLICNFRLPEVDVMVPFILVGPPGIRVILLTRDRGIFRAKQQQWLVHTGKGFKPVKENLIRKTQLYVSAVQKFLGQNGYQDIDVKGLLVGVNPGMHVETQEASVRVIQSDAIRRFGTQWVQRQSVLSPEQIYKIVLSISKASKPEIEEGKNLRSQLEPKEDKFDKSLEPLKRTLNFSSKQWIIIGILIIGTILVLLLFMIIIIFSL
jgi:hypothetical protein